MITSRGDISSKFTADREQQGWPHVTWGQFGLAVVGGVCGSVLTQAATFLRDWLTKKDEGRFTAMMLSLALEDYASRCATTVGTHDTYLSSKGSTAEPDASLPSLPPFAKKTNWRSVGVTHTSAVMGLRVNLDTANGYIADLGAHTDSGRVWDATAGKAVELGLAALKVSTELRKAFNLGPPPAIETVPEYNVLEYLVREAAQRAEVRTRRLAKMTASAEPGSA